MTERGKRDWINNEPDRADGYRDIKLNVDMGHGLVAEVQINLTEMLAAKEQAHPLYEEREAIDRAGRARGGITPEERARIDALNAQQREIYDAALEASRTRATNGQNAASFIPEPLRRADDGSKSRGGSVSHATQYVTEPGSDGLNAAGTAAAVRSSETWISPSISKNSGIGEHPPSRNIEAANREITGNRDPSETFDRAVARAHGALLTTDNVLFAVDRLPKTDRPHWVKSGCSCPGAPATAALGRSRPTRLLQAICP